MKIHFRRTRWRVKVLCLFLSFAFLILNVSCSHSPNKSRGGQEIRGDDVSVGGTEAAKADSRGAPWWKKPEHEWLIATLIVIGVGIVAGAAIMISSGPGGLSVQVQK